MAVVTNWLGIGWKFPVAINASGGFSVSEGEDNLKESLRILLSTKPGERVLRTDYGCALASDVFLPNNEMLLNRIKLDVEDAIRTYEPRVTIDSDNINEPLGTVVEFDSVDDSKVNIFITYRIRATNMIDNLTYPYYIIQSSA